MGREVQGGQRNQKGMQPVKSPSVVVGSTLPVCTFLSVSRGLLKSPASALWVQPQLLSVTGMHELLNIQHLVVGSTPNVQYVNYA